MRKRQPGLLFEALLALLRTSRAYHRYECEGYHNIPVDRSALLVGYHGRPFAWDYYHLALKLYEDCGYYPRTFTLHTFQWLPLLNRLSEQAGALYEVPAPAEMARIKNAGEKIIVLPGGSREALRPFWVPAQVDFGRRRGYLRFAANNDLPVVPFVASGVDSVYLGINDGYRLSRRLFGHGKIPLWGGIGIGGLWPLALPWPTKIRQRIGEPIDLAPLRAQSNNEADFLERANQRVTQAMQQMLDEVAT